MVFHFILISDECVMVSMQGEDEPECLTASRTMPCKTLNYAIAAGHSVVCMSGMFHSIPIDIDMTNIDNGTHENHVTIVCISCQLVNSKVTLQSSLSRAGFMSFVDFPITDGSIELRNIFLMLRNVVLEQVSIDGLENVPNQVHFEESSLTCTDIKTCGLSLLNSSTVTCIIRQSRLNGFKLDLNTEGIMLVITDTFIEQADIHVKVHSPGYLRIPSLIEFHNVTVESLRPEVRTGSSSSRRKRSIQPLFSDTEIVLQLTNPYFHISRSNFFRTHLEIVASRQEFDHAYFWGVIVDTEFSNTNHMGDGGALMITSQVPNSRLLITSCNLVNNTAVKSTSGLQGHGGGISLKSISLQVEIKNTVFAGNKANDVGLDLYTSEGVIVSLNNCSFSYSVDPINPIQAELVFIAGITSQMQSNFKVINLQPGSYVGPIKVFYIAKGNDLDLIITCPRWYGHNDQFALSSSGIDIMDIRYECDSCSDNYYTTSPTQNVLSYAGNISTISSEDRNNTLTMTLEGGNGTDGICIECPYGAICTGNNVLPRSNYWGYWYEGELVFLQCPALYCCSGGSCDVYDYCAGNKTGTLCGECQDGFSVSILTGACTPDSACGNANWFWLFAFIIAMAYALWYTFKDDIFAFFFASLANIRGLCNRSNRKVDAVRHIDVRENEKNSIDNISKNDVVSLQESETGDTEVRKTDKGSVYNVSKSDVISLQASYPGDIVRGVEGKDQDKHSIDDIDENNRTSHEDTGDADEDDDVDKGYFGIVTYYVQMADVFLIQVEFSEVDNSESFLDTLVNNIARFLNLELTQVSFDVCPIVGLTTLGKHLYSLGFLFGIYICWLVLFLCVSFVIALGSGKKNMSALGPKLHSFKMKLVNGIVEIIKYTYAGFCGVIFMSLACTQLGKDYVWWYDGTNVCLENWQIAIVIFAAVYAFPFPIVLVYGLKMLKRNEISAATFISCCLCPLAIIVFMVKQKFMKANMTEEEGKLPEASQTVISNLQGPFREDDESMTLYWEAMISIRRLLITGMTLVGYASVRMIIITIISLLFLIQHIFMRPFLVKTSNHVETFSLLLLSIAAVINLLKASLTDSGVVPSGPTVPFFKTIELCEKMFVLLIIAFILIVEIRLRKSNKN